jgi:hypothetical protein
MIESVPPPIDRRTGERYLACFPASVIRPDGEQRPSLIRDISNSGVLLLVYTTRLEVGDQIKLLLYISEDATQFREVRGKVVRVEKRTPEDTGPWLRRVAVHFDEELTVYDEEIASFQARARLLGHKP